MKRLPPLAALIVLPVLPGVVPATTNQGVPNVLGIQLYPSCLRTADQAQAAGFSCITESITFYTGLLLTLIAVAAFFYFLYGAFLYVSAFGDENKAKQGKTTITYALIGIVVAVLAQVLVNLLKGILQVSP